MSVNFFHFKEKICKIYLQDDNFVIYYSVKYFLNPKGYVKECSVMSRMVGTVSRGVRAPIIRKGDDIAKIVTESIITAAREEGYEIKINYIPRLDYLKIINQIYFKGELV